MVLPLFTLFTLMQTPVFAQDPATLFYRQCLAESKARIEMTEPLQKMDKQCTDLQLLNGTTQGALKIKDLNEELKKLYLTLSQNLTSYVPYIQIEEKLSAEKKRVQEEACTQDNLKLKKKNQLVTNRILSCLKNFSAPQIQSNQNENKTPRPLLKPGSPETQTPLDPNKAL